MNYKLQFLSEIVQCPAGALGFNLIPNNKIIRFKTTYNLQSNHCNNFYEIRKCPQIITNQKSSTTDNKLLHQLSTVDSTLLHQLSTVIIACFVSSLAVDSTLLQPCTDSTISSSIYFANSTLLHQLVLLIILYFSYLLLIAHSFIIYLLVITHYLSYLLLIAQSYLLLIVNFFLSYL